MTLSYAQGQTNTVFSLKLLILILAGFILGLLTFYPVRMRLKLKKKKKAAKKQRFDEGNTIIESFNE